MPGIYGALSLGNWNTETNIYKNFHSYNFLGTINEEIKYESFLFGRSVIPKFLDDRVLYENELIVLGFEGVCQNIKRGNLVNEILNGFEKEGAIFINQLKGSFSGFIYDKRKNVLHLFTDHLSTKPIYYYLNKSSGIFFFSSELKVISKVLRKSGVSISLNQDAIRCLLTFGYMLNDITPVSEIKKMQSGSILSLSIKDLKVDNKIYFNLRKNVVSNYSQEELVDEVDRLLSNAVIEEWNKDLEYSYKHFAFLSGGLDSRVNVMLAHEMGFKEINLLTFSEKGTFDEIVSKQIANNLDLKHTFIELENGKYLESDLQEYININDGLAVLYGAAHMYNSLEKNNLNEFGFAHSGQIGDAVFGSLYKNSSPDKNLKKLCYGSNYELIEKISAWKELKENNFYGDDFEIFSYKNRVINGALNGDRSVSYLIDSVSPFYDKELLKLCINLPSNLKNNSFLYKVWMEKKHPQIQNYKWQASGTYPRNGAFWDIIHLKNRILRYGLRKIGFERENMNPFQNWFENNSLIKERINKIFKENISLIDDKELESDIIGEFHSESVTSKMNAISALLSVKLHFYG